MTCNIFEFEQFLRYLIILKELELNCQALSLKEERRLEIITFGLLTAMDLHQEKAHFKYFAFLLSSSSCELFALIYQVNFHQGSHMQYDK